MRHRSLLLVAGICASALTVAACGSDNKDKNESKSAQATPLTIGIAAQGKTAAYTVPTTVKGGLVTITFKNSDKAPRAAQLVRVEGNHTVQEAVKATSGDSNKTPDWIRAEGGAATTAPGQTSSASVNLPAGKYFVTDLGGPGSSGPPPYKAFTVTAGDNGSLPKTDTTITAANPSKDKYKWEISGPLKVGDNKVTFDSKGDEAIHFIGAFRVTGNQSLAEIQKALATQNGPPPKFIDQSSFFTTAILDGGKADTTSVNLPKAGNWVLFCPLTDREGGKSHDQEGLITKVKVG